MAPYIIPFDFGGSPIYAGQTAQAACFTSEGDLPLEIYWSFQGSQSLEHLGITTSKISRRASALMIDEVNLQHQGNYTCTARNWAGIVNYTAKLDIHGIL